MQSPAGKGPWFCGLLINAVADGPKKTIIAPHSTLHSYVDGLNGPKKSDEYWVVSLKVGPFSSWHQCMAFSRLWSEDTSGIEPRRERGYLLYTHYKTLYKLRLWGAGGGEGDSMEMLSGPLYRMPSISVTKTKQQQKNFTHKNNSNNTLLGTVDRVLGQNNGDSENTPVQVGCFRQLRDLLLEKSAPKRSRISL